MNEVRHICPQCGKEVDKTAEVMGLKIEQLYNIHGAIHQRIGWLQNLERSREKLNQFFDQIVQTGTIENKLPIDSSYNLFLAGLDEVAELKAFLKLFSDDYKEEEIPIEIQEAT